MFIAQRRRLKHKLRQERNVTPLTGLGSEGGALKLETFRPYGT